jgi:hypothetical protein
MEIIHSAPSVMAKELDLQVSEASPYRQGRHIKLIARKGDTTTLAPKARQTLEP